MKTTRRLLTLALALILTLALAIPSMAADGEGSITVTGAGETVYEVYKMFEIEAANGSTEDYKYKLAVGWELFTAEDYFSVVNGYVIWQKSTVSAADAAAVAQKAKAYVEANGTIDAVTTVKVGDTQNVDPGYYLLAPTNDSTCGVIMVTAGEAVTVNEKTTAPGHPTVEKLVQEDSVKTYGASNTADIGQIINFQTTITAGVNAEKYVLHDKMDEHIAYEGGVVVTRDGNEVPAVGNYNVNIAPEDGCTFHIEFTDTLCSSLADDAMIVVRYTGKLTENAATSDEHTNTTWLTYTADAVPSNESSTTTTTTKITVKKVDQDANLLAGAGFILRDNIGKYYSWNDTDKAVEWVELADDAEKIAAAKVTNATGIIEFAGVDAENFYLEEVVIPDGYTGVTETAVSTKDGDKEVTVTNTLGQALPETGGIGTTVFYIVGIALVLGALVALVIIKRKNAAAQ